MQLGAHFLDDAREAGAGAVHLVDEGDAGDAVAVGLAPYGLALGLYAADGAEHADRAVEHAQGALDLGREIDVSGSVDDVDLAALPEAGGVGAGDGDAAFLLLGHPVHDGGAVVHFAHLVDLAGIEEDSLGGGGLARVDVRDHADVADVRQGVFARRGCGGAGFAVFCHDDASSSGNFRKPYHLGGRGANRKTGEGEVRGRNGGGGRGWRGRGCGGGRRGGRFRRRRRRFRGGGRLRRPGAWRFCLRG